MFPNSNNISRNPHAGYYDFYRNQAPQPISIYAFPLPDPKNEKNKMKNMLKRKSDTVFVNQPQNKRFRNKLQADRPPKIPTQSQQNLYKKIVEVARTNKIFTSPLQSDELNELINSNTSPEFVDFSHIIKNYPLAKLSGMPTVTKMDSEIRQIVDSVTLPEPVYESFVEKIVNDLNTAFKMQGYTNKWNLFGSYLYGLVNVRSDVDLYYECVNEGDAASLIPQTILTKMRKSLPKSKLFFKVTLIKNARVPLLRVVHWGTKKQLDISVSNSLGVRNSLLLKLYLNMNPTLKYLNLYLREIFKKYDCYGAGKLTTYILFWLVAFFMQQKKLLPAVIDVRKSATEKHEVLGWDCSLPETYSYSSPPLSLYALLLEFFAFYKDFDFLNYVICPSVGRAFLLSDFDRLRIPSEFSAYVNRLETLEQCTFSRNVMNLQDPSDLGFNLAKQISVAYASKFKSICHCLNNALPKSITDLGKISSLREIIPNKINFYSYRPRDLVQYCFTMIQLKGWPEHLASKINNDYVLEAIRKLMELVFGFEKVDIVVTPDVTQVSFSDGKFNKNTASVIYYEYHSTENTWKNDIIKEIIPECENGAEAIKVYLTTELCLDRNWIRILVQTQVDFARFIRENSTQLFTFALQEVLPQAQS